MMTFSKWDYVCVCESTSISTDPSEATKRKLTISGFRWCMRVRNSFEIIYLNLLVVTPSWDARQWKPCDSTTWWVAGNRFSLFFFGCNSYSFCIFLFPVVAVPDCGKNPSQKRTKKWLNGSRHSWKLWPRQIQFSTPPLFFKPSRNKNFILSWNGARLDRVCVPITLVSHQTAGGNRRQMPTSTNP